VFGGTVLIVDSPSVLAYIVKSGVMNVVRNISVACDHIGTIRPMTWKHQIKNSWVVFDDDLLNSYESGNAALPGFLDLEAGIGGKPDRARFEGEKSMWTMLHKFDYRMTMTPLPPMRLSNTCELSGGLFEYTTAD
jgi:hypothetical protein